ncbi:MAG TPA: chemotaxis protein CheW [Roseateles sp.]|nr:chemotaxis protein CheW [Roseateles sp.]
MNTGDALQGRIAQWREAFDRAFADPLPEPGPAPIDYLGLSLAGQPHALRLAELATLQALEGSPLPYPGAPPQLLGLIALRGKVLPLFDLQALLGLGPGQRPTWLVLPRNAALALAFEHFDGHWRLPPSACVLSPQGHVLRCAEQQRPLIDLSRVIAQLAPPA